LSASLDPRRQHCRAGTGTLMFGRRRHPAQLEGGVAGAVGVSARHPCGDRDQRSVVVGDAEMERRLELVTVEHDRSVGASFPQHLPA
jgi:hypothetical protein